MNRRLQIGFLVAAWLLASLAFTPAAQASVIAAANQSVAAKSAGGSVIVFQVSSGGAIYAMKPDGTSLRYLTDGMDPALSPDGGQVAFTRWDGQNNGVTGSLWVINVDGTGLRQVMSGANQPKSPTWSADGKQIVISMQAGGTLTDAYLCTVNGAPTELPAPIDGQRCMKKAADPGWGLRTVDVATGLYEDLYREQHSFAPTWNPAQSWQVVFRGDKGLESLDVNLNTLTVLKNLGSYLGPVFSPDGNKLAVTFKQVDHYEVHVLNADGSGEARLTETPSTVRTQALLAGQAVRQWNNAAPAWSPDGKQIAFVTDRSGAYEIWVMNADGSNQHVLVSTATLASLGQTLQYQGQDERVISWR